MVSAKTSAKTGDVAPRPEDRNWVVSETTSPVDYSPIVTAVMQVPSGVKDTPDTLMMRCRALRTELLIRTEGAWRVGRGSDVEVDYQVNNQAVVRQPWTASADGKTASYKNDAADLLQSLPEGAQLKIKVLDGPGAGHEATFHLAGLDAIRRKISAACKTLTQMDAYGRQTVITETSKRKR
jgi:hypothetical protein